jgi:drug/metabolite transporter (DMT)-like permease
MKAYVLGLLGVVIFGMTFPMTRLAVGTPELPQLTPWFSAFARAAVAGILSLAYLAYSHYVHNTQQLTSIRRLSRPELGSLVVTALGVVFGFPLLTAWALRYVEAIHAAVLIGFLPLATAGLGAWMANQRPSKGFWFCAVLGSGLVVVYALLHNQGSQWLFHPADLLLILAVACAAVGYAKGAALSSRLGGAEVICWALVIALPISLPVTLLLLPSSNAGHVLWTAWLGLFYISVFSMWLGFFAWYKALALGGTVRISQIQLLQPMFSMVFAVPILGERLDLMTLVFAVAVIATVFVGKKMPITAR